jgi:predicted aspartyl protease
MGMVHATIDLENAVDSAHALSGLVSPEKIRRHSLRGMVDTGAVMLVLPQDVVEHLGLLRHGKSVMTFADDRKAEWERAGPVTLRIGNRSGHFDCLVGPPTSEALIGHIVLEQLDLLVDPLKQVLSVRPESPLLPMLSMK